ncbi:MAG: phosphopantetheine-binding protein [Gemmatimonadales bacterium]
MSSETAGRPEAPLTLEALRADVAAVLFESPDEIGDEDNLVDHGLDSIRIMALVQRWNDAGARIDFASLAERPELTHWWHLISRSMQP